MHGLLFCETAMVFFGCGASFATDRTLGLANLQRMSDGFFLKVAYLIRK